MALKGPFTYYLDMIIDSFLLANFIKALDGIGNVIQNYNSFPSTVSRNIEFFNRLMYSMIPDYHSHLNNCSYCKVSKNINNKHSILNKCIPHPLIPLPPTPLILRYPCHTTFCIFLASNKYHVTIVNCSLKK